jgi:hypothetical protein
MMGVIESVCLVGHRMAVVLVTNGSPVSVVDGGCFVNCRA